LEAHFSVVAGVGAAERRLDRPLYTCEVSRINVSPGQTRDLGKPLVEVEPNAPWATRLAQRLFKAYVSAIVVYSLFAVALVALILLVLLIAR
jgi:hypothetical protein